MSEEGEDGEIENLPFHEYCANCGRRYDETILNPSVALAELDGERVPHSFCDKDCLAEWAANE